MSERLDETRISRRRALSAGAGAAAGLSLAGLLNGGALARAGKRPLATEGSFDHGIASGFPRPRGGVFWTKLTDLDRTARVQYEIATDENFAEPPAQRDHQVHALARSPAR